MQTTTIISPACIQLRGIRLLNVDMDEAVAAIEAALVAKVPTKICFVNADCVNLAAKKPEYLAHLQQADWVFVDGVGMRIAGRVTQQPVRDNVNGTDMFPLLCASMAEHGHKVFLLGARRGVAEAAAQWAQEHYPDLKIVGTQDGYHAPQVQWAIAQQIKESKADVLLLALGAPYQEAWIAEYMQQTGVTVALGVGGLFDYYSGRIPRAPYWMRKLSLEWLFRLIQEPRRLWRRYLIGNISFLARIGVDWLKQKMHSILS